MQITQIFSGKFYSTPYPVTMKPWKVMIITTAIVMAILFLAHPWGKVTWGENLYVTFLTGVLTALVESIFYFLLPRIFPKWYDREHWTIGKDILNTIVMLFAIATTIFSFFVVFFRMPTSWEVIGSYLLYFLLVIPFPTFFAYLWQQNLILQRNLKLANDMNERILQTSSTPECREEVEKTISLQDGKNNNFEFSPSHLLYIVSDGNYVNIVVEKEGKSESRMVRSTMKNVEELLFEEKSIVRCHRSYLVNLDKVQMVTGNALECQIHFKDSSDTIPVSRNYRPQILNQVKG